MLGLTRAWGVRLSSRDGRPGFFWIDGALGLEAGRGSQARGLTARTKPLMRCTPSGSGGAPQMVFSGVPS